MFAVKESALRGGEESGRRWEKERLEEKQMESWNKRRALDFSGMI